MGTHTAQPGVPIITQSGEVLCAHFSAPKHCPAHQSCMSRAMFQCPPVPRHPRCSHPPQHPPAGPSPAPHRFCTMFITIQSPGYTVFPIRSLKRIKVSMRKSCKEGRDVRSCAGLQCPPGDAVREVLVPEVLPWGSTHHQLRPGGECLDVGAVVVLVHLAQDGGHAGHVVALGERSWSSPAGSCSCTMEQDAVLFLQSLCNPEPQLPWGLFTPTFPSPSFPSTPNLFSRAFHVHFPDCVSHFCTHHDARGMQV